MKRREFIKKFSLAAVVGAILPRFMSDFLQERPDPVIIPYDAQVGYEEGNPHDWYAYNLQTGEVFTGTGFHNGTDDLMFGSKETVEIVRDWQQLRRHPSVAKG